NNENIEIKAKANEKGHLFKSINPKDVVLAIKKNTGIDIEEDSIFMNNIKEVGLYTIEIKKENKRGEFKIKIEKE
ncbi:MAG: 50S ribosomal L9 C-terminal domain-containing protein, partial [Candidatus Pacebacteria bacterium]|nr:50S ribosomal L9 C-terminal domain-containing protein [Candidatus Paceibacterota bacterium]